MPDTTCHMSISLDGFVAGPDQSREHPLGKRGIELHGWHIGDERANEADEIAAGWLMRPRGAYLMGRNMFGPIRGEGALHANASGMERCDRDHGDAEGCRVPAPRGSAELERLARDPPRHGEAAADRHGVHDPGHRLLVGADVGGRDVALRADEAAELARIPPVARSISPRE